MNVRIIIFAGLLLLFQACRVGPTYKNPQVNVPSRYREQQTSIVDNSLSEWWTIFNDPYLTLLIKKAVKENYDLKIACEQIIQARAFYGIQSALFYPEIDVVSSVNQSRLSKNINAYNTIPSQAYSYFSLGLEALWELDFWGKVRHAKQSACYLIQAQEEHMHDVRIILISDVVKAYIMIRALQQKITLIKKQIIVDTKLLALLRDRFKSGIDDTIPSIDQLTALDESNNQLLLFKTMLTSTINSLAVLLGQNPEDFIINATRNGVPLSIKKISTGLPSELLRRRPDIRYAEKILASATEDVGQAVATWFPSFSLIGSSVLESNKLSRLFSGNSLSWSIGPSLNWPILTFGRIRFFVKEKKSLRRQALLKYCKSVITAFGDVENALITHLNAEKEFALITRKLSAACAKKELIQSLFDAGLKNYLDLLDAEKSYIMRHIDQIEAQQALSISVVSVYKALGGGW